MSVDRKIAEVAAHEVHVLRDIIGKLAELTGLVIDGRELRYAYDEYSAWHEFTLEELEVIAVNELIPIRGES